MFFVEDGKYVETTNTDFVVEDGKYVELLPSVFLVEDGKFVELMGGGSASIIVYGNFSSEKNQYSLDGGLIWAEATTNNVGSFRSLATNGKRIVGTRVTTSESIAYTVDGSLWTKVSASKDSSNVNPISYFPEIDKFAWLRSTQGSSALDWTVALSEDGVTWRHQTNGMVASAVLQMAPIVYDVANDAYLSVKMGSYVVRLPGKDNLLTSGWYDASASGPALNVAVNELGVAVVHNATKNSKMYSVNGGVSWTEVQGTSDTGKFVFYGGGIFIAIPYNATGLPIYYSKDGKTWNNSGVNLYLYNANSKVFHDGEKFFLLGKKDASQNGLYQSFDGKTWTKLSTPPDYMGHISYLE